ncbi:TetR/AcrR family transcriptional regulator [Nocardia salmonicida]|uniref:TetR/AcrR family transcriptional regulator n=1 Tax=Nocardia salmonicida TaxID=53431 RepID=UPI003412ABFA
MIEAAARILVDQGYAATRLSDIAAEAGMQAGSLYYHFDSKESLVEEVLRYGLQFTHTHVRVIVEQLPDEATPGEQLRAAVAGFLEATLELGNMSPAHVRTFHQLPIDIQDRLRPMRRAFGRFWEDLIDAAIASGEIRSDVDPLTLRLFIISSLEQVAEWPPKARRNLRDLSGVMQTLIFDGVGNDGTRSA